MPENETTIAEAGVAPEAPLDAAQGAPSPGATLQPTEATTSATEAGDPNSPGDMAAALEAPSAIHQGALIQGLILKITDDVVFVDLGLKSEAALARAEFADEEGRISVEPGQTIDVWVEQYDEQGGSVAASYRKAVQEKTWHAIEEAFENQTPLRGKVIERVKGGLAVDAGVRVFLPGSQADVRPHPSLDALVGQEITFKVVKLNRKRMNVVISRKQILEEELETRRAALREQLVEGAILTGRVKNLTDYGAFVDLGGLDGLIHVTDLTWGRVAHPSEVLQSDQEVRVKVLKFDPEKQRVSLGVKQLTPDPWEDVPSTYHTGDRVKGRIVSTTDYGAFAELGPGVEGLVHISEMSWSKSLKHPSKIVSVGDWVEVGILDVNPAQRRISLSLKQALPDPWANIAERYAVNSVVQGRVRHLTDFGAFVELEEGVDGLIHVSNLSRTKHVKHPSEVLHKGQKVEAMVLGVDAEKRRLSLGMKQLQPDVWENFFGKTQVGDAVRGKVVRLAAFGAFVELEEGIEGLCHTSEYGDDKEDSAARSPQVGSELEFRVLRLTPSEKKVALSLRKAVAAAHAPESVKPPEPPSLSRMAEALSSAGIHTGAQLRAATGASEK